MRRGYLKVPVRAVGVIAASLFGIDHPEGLQELVQVHEAVLVHVHQLADVDELFLGDGVGHVLPYEVAGVGKLLQADVA